MNGITRRALVVGDIPAITRVHFRACGVAYKFMNWSYSEKEVYDWYVGKFAEWDWGLVAATAEAGVVGFVATSGAHLDQLFVDPGHQQLGVGTFLLNAALAKMPGPVTLHVFEENRPARRFYERFKFRQASSFFNEQERAVELVYRRGAPDVTASP